jgi:hypothetical protein
MLKKLSLIGLLALPLQGTAGSDSDRKPKSGKKPSPWAGLKRGSSSSASLKERPLPPVPVQEASVAPIQPTITDEAKSDDTAVVVPASVPVAEPVVAAPVVPVEKESTQTSAESVVPVAVTTEVVVASAVPAVTSVEQSPVVVTEPPVVAVQQDLPKIEERVAVQAATSATEPVVATLVADSVNSGAGCLNFGTEVATTEVVKTSAVPAVTPVEQSPTPVAELPVAVAQQDLPTVVEDVVVQPATSTAEPVVAAPVADSVDPVVVEIAEVVQTIAAPAVTPVEQSQEEKKLQATIADLLATKETTEAEAAKENKTSAQPLNTAAVKNTAPAVSENANAKAQKKNPLLAWLTAQRAKFAPNTKKQYLIAAALVVGGALGLFKLGKTVVARSKKKEQTDKDMPSEEEQAAIEERYAELIEALEAEMQTYEGAEKSPEVSR